MILKFRVQRENETSGWTYIDNIKELNSKDYGNYRLKVTRGKKGEQSTERRRSHGFAVLVQLLHSTTVNLSFTDSCSAGCQRNYSMIILCNIEAYCYCD